MSRRTRQRMVVAWRDIDGLTFAEIGNRLEITRQRAQQIYTEAQRPWPVVQHGPYVSTLNQALAMSYYATVLLRWARHLTPSEPDA